jgi:hypothetical protein
VARVEEGFLEEERRPLEVERGRAEFVNAIEEHSKTDSPERE